MPGKRQPTQVLEANGRKHLTEAEKDARRDREVHVPPPDEVAPPKWLPKRLHGEYREIGEILRAAGLYAELDRDVLGQYFLSRERWLRADKRAGAAIRAGDEKLAREWTGIQGTYFKQAHGLMRGGRIHAAAPTAAGGSAGGGHINAGARPRVL